MISGKLSAKAFNQKNRGSWLDIKFEEICFKKCLTPTCLKHCDESNTFWSFSLLKYGSCLNSLGSKWTVRGGWTIAGPSTSRTVYFGSLRPSTLDFTRLKPSLLWFKCINWNCFRNCSSSCIYSVTNRCNISIPSFTWFNSAWKSS